LEVGASRGTGAGNQNPLGNSGAGDYESVVGGGFSEILIRGRREKPLGIEGGFGSVEGIELGGMRYGERSKQYGTEKLKNGKIAANTQGQSKDYREGKTGRPAQLTRGVAEVGEQDVIGGQWFGTSLADSKTRLRYQSTYCGYTLALDGVDAMDIGTQ
jgi:hypothetical protein